ncbi:MerR family transcriptional regulator [Nitriliruptoraceae bacterium ZYF776]|nr:MerR family transcriptional regulator [Profundirhabdus halotolerans]
MSSRPPRAISSTSPPRHLVGSPARRPPASAPPEGGTRGEVTLGRRGYAAPMKLRIDELAAHAGTTSRNVRAYQARGLLPPPELQGRTGYYGEEHLNRLRVIGDLQERGFSLEAIRQTLDAWATGGDLGSLLGFEHLISAPLTDEAPARLTLEEVVARFPEARDDPALVERAVSLGLITPQDDGDLEAPSPMVVDAGAQLVRIGVPLADVLDLVEAIQRDVADIADRFLAMVSEHVVAPIVEGHPDAQPVDEVLTTLRQLRPIALEVVRPFLAQAMRQAIDRTVANQAEQLDAIARDDDQAS